MSSAVAEPMPVPAAAPSPDTPDAETAPRRFRWTLEAYYQAYDAGLFGFERKLELLNGEVYYKLPEDPKHVEGIDDIVDALAGVLDLTTCHIRQQHPLRLPGDSEPEPDVTVIAGQRRAYRGRHPQASEALLVVEVANRTIYTDRKIKAPLYAAAGIREYWILNVVARELEVHRLTEGGAYGEPAILKPGQTVSPLAAPHATIAVADLLPPAPDASPG